MVICTCVKQQELLRELGDIDIGVGTLQATNTRVYEAVEPAVTSLRQWVQDQPHVHVDETPWPVLGRSVCGGRFPRKTSLVKEWLWVSAQEKFCLFHAGDTRSRAEARATVGV